MPIRSSILTAAAVFAAAAPARAAGPLEVAAKVLVEARRSASDGTTRISLVAAGKVVPGDRVIYILEYRNTGTAPLADVVIANPLPRGIAYRAPAVGSGAPELSVDGTTFGALADLRVRTIAGAVRAAAADDVTHVRWRLPRPLPGGAHGQFAFQAVLK